MTEGMKLTDWASMTNYYLSTSSYISDFINFTNQLNSSQQAILLPQASYGGMMSQYGTWHDPDQIFDWFLSDSRVIGIIPFLWSHHDTDGVKDISSLQTAYSNYGKQIKQDLIVYADVYCELDGQSWENFTCTASASGGTGGFSYEWSDTTQTGSTAYYNLQCPHPQSGDGSDVSQTVQVTVTDSSGHYAKDTDVLQCP